MKHFLAAIAIWIFLQTIFVYLLTYPTSEFRWDAQKYSYIEDDSLNHTIKAHQWLNCRYQDCPGLKSLKAQLDLPPVNRTMQEHQFRVAFREFYWYSPLQTVLLAEISRISGWDLEFVFNLWRLMGSLIIGIGIYLLAAAFIGPLPGVLATLAVGTQLFPKQGLHMVVPSNIALGLGFIVWALLLKPENKSNRWIALLCLLLVVWLHPVGQVIFAASILFLLWLHGFQKTLRDPLPWISGLNLLVYLVATNTINQPMIGMPAAVPLDHSYLKWTWYGISGIRQVIEDEIANLGGVLFVGIAACWGAFHLEPGTRKKLKGLTFIIGFFFVVSLFYKNGIFFIELPTRLTIPLMVLLITLMSFGLWKAFQNQLQDKVVRALVVGVIVSGVYNLVDRGFELHIRTFTEMRSLYFAFDKAHVDKLLEKTKPSDSIVYLDEFNLIYFLGKGADAVKAIYWPIFVTEDLRSKWLLENRPKYIVNAGPAMNAPHVRNSGFKIKEIPVANVSFPKQSRLQSVKIRLTTLQSNTIIASWEQNGIYEDLIREIPPCFQCNVHLRLNKEVNVAKINIRFSNAGDRSAVLYGINFNEDELLWPWAMRARIDLNGPGSVSHQLDFDFEKMLDRQLQVLDLKVVADGPNTVLAEVVNSGSNQ